MHGQPILAFHIVSSHQTVKPTFLPVNFSNIWRNLSVIFSFCFLYFPGCTLWPACETLSARCNDVAVVYIGLLDVYLSASHLLDFVERFVEVVLSSAWAIRHVTAGDDAGLSCLLFLEVYGWMY